jgi:hypothetical protein
MDNLSCFESRVGKLTCNAEELFNFVTDMRNFDRFIPEGSVSSWQAEKESCRFSVSMIGNVSLRVTSKEKFSRVAYNGNALNKNDFELVLHITDNFTDPAEVRLELNAELNPVMKTVAEKPITQFLEVLIIEMEKFRGWKEIKG